MVSILSCRHLKGRGRERERGWGEKEKEEKGEISSRQNDREFQRQLGKIHQA